MIAFNLTRNLVLVRELRLAHSFFERIWNLSGSSSLKEGEGFLIPFCHGIHTFGIDYPIDVLYLNGDGDVIGMDEGLGPNSIGKFCLRACLVLELPAGMIHSTETKIGDLLTIQGSGATGTEELISLASPVRALLGLNT